MAVSGVAEYTEDGGLDEYFLPQLHSMKPRRPRELPRATLGVLRGFILGTAPGALPVSNRALHTYYSVACLKPNGLDDS